MLIQQAEANGVITDVRIKEGKICEIAPTLTARDGETVIKAQGNALLAGLHDHHIHLNATAAALNSVKCGPPVVSTENALRKALHTAFAAAPDRTEIRGIGYYESVAGDIDCHWLDKNGPDLPIRIQHRTGRLWIFNSKAKQQLNYPVPDDGRLFDADSEIRQKSGQGQPDLTALVQKLLSFGITGVTEVTPNNTADDFIHLRDATVPLRVRIMGQHSLSPDLATGHSSLGQVKLHYHEHDLPDVDTLSALIKKAHDSGRGIASHCVTHAELMMTLLALDQAGAHKDDRIEHAALTSPAALELIQKLDVAVVTQPNFIGERAEAYERDVAAEDHPCLWRVGSFQAAGVPLAAGSDAPFGDFDPWAAMAHACTRPEALDFGESVPPEQALALYQKQAEDLRRTRKVQIGEPADLCLLTSDWQQARRDLGAVTVAATFIDGECVYSRS